MPQASGFRLPRVRAVTLGRRSLLSTVSVAFTVISLVRLVIPFNAIPSSFLECALEFFFVRVLPFTFDPEVVLVWHVVLRGMIFVVGSMAFVVSTVAFVVSDMTFVVRGVTIFSLGVVEWRR